MSSFRHHQAARFGFASARDVDGLPASTKRQLSSELIEIRDELIRNANSQGTWMHQYLPNKMRNALRSRGVHYDNTSGNFTDLWNQIYVNRDWSVQERIIAARDSRRLVGDSVARDTWATMAALDTLVALLRYFDIFAQQ